MKNYIIVLVALAVCSYFVGNFNNAITISKLKGKDIRKIGSGNPGTMNMSRTFGLKIALLVFVLDVLKGAIPTLVAYFVFRNWTLDLSFPPYLVAKIVCGFCAVFGHVFPVFYKFKGGKGIASTLGVFVAINPLFTVVLGIVCGLLFIFITRMGSMGSFLATTPTAIAIIIKAYFSYAENLSGVAVAFYSLFCFFMCLTIALTWFAHRENIKRLLNGSEHNTDWWLSIKKGILKMKYGKEK